MNAEAFRIAAESNARLVALGIHLNQLKAITTKAQLIAKLSSMELSQAQVETQTMPLIAAAQVDFDAEQAVFDGL